VHPAVQSRRDPARNRATHQARRPAWTLCPTPGTSRRPKPVLQALPGPIAVVPFGQPAAAVRDWFDAAAEALFPDHDETRGTARQAADA